MHHVIPFFYNLDVDIPIFIIKIWHIIICRKKRLIYIFYRFFRSVIHFWVSMRVTWQNEELKCFVVSFAKGLETFSESFSESFDELIVEDAHGGIKRKKHRINVLFFFRAVFEIVFYFVYWNVLISLLRFKNLRTKLIFKLKLPCST